jgi:hypothetical protein
MASDPPRRPIGRALRRTADERERLAEVTAADVIAARTLWHANAPPGWGALIEARPEPEGETTR